MDIKEIVETWLSLRPNDYRDIVFCGQVFGGRYGESPQMPRRCEYEKGILRLFFAGTEMLTVIRPSPPVIDQAAALIIPDGERATFGWHYYGREQIPENWCEKTYIKDIDSVLVITSGPIVPHLPARCVFHYGGKEFVRIV